MKAITRPREGKKLGSVTRDKGFKTQIEKYLRALRGG